jgi:hypothetical protein
MNQETREILILDYLNGELAGEPLKHFESMLASGEIKKEEVEQMTFMLSGLDAMPAPEPGINLDLKFYGMLAAEMERKKKPSFLSALQAFWLSAWPARLAYSLLVFVVGFAIAWGVKPKAVNKDADLQMLSQEVQQMKEMLVFTLIEQSSASERIKAVNLSQGMDAADQRILEALFKTLDYDPNVNVRLAAVEALKAHAAHPEVRAQLVKSITKQESPMVQVAMADLMVELQEKAALPALKLLLQQEDLNELVKQKVETSIQTLI